MHLCGQRYVEMSQKYEFMAKTLTVSSIDTKFSAIFMLKCIAKFCIVGQRWRRLGQLEIYVSTKVHLSGSTRVQLLKTVLSKIKNS